MFSNEETDISSADWLKIHGIDAQKLDFFSVLHAAAFRHCDGVVTLLKPPGNSFDIKDNTPAVSSTRLYQLFVNFSIKNIKLCFFRTLKIN